jgi:hypothetical protein
MVGTRRFTLPVYVMQMEHSMDMIHGHGITVQDLLTTKVIHSKPVHNHSMEIGPIYGRYPIVTKLTLLYMKKGLIITSSLSLLLAVF